MYLQVFLKSDLADPTGRLTLAYFLTDSSTYDSEWNFPIFTWPLQQYWVSWCRWINRLYPQKNPRSTALIRTFTLISVLATTSVSRYIKRILIGTTMIFWTRSTINNPPQPYPSHPPSMDRCKVNPTTSLTYLPQILPLPSTECLIMSDSTNTSLLHPPLPLLRMPAMKTY